MPKVKKVTESASKETATKSKAIAKPKKEISTRTRSKAVPKEESSPVPKRRTRTAASKAKSVSPKTNQKKKATPKGKGKENVRQNKEKKRAIEEVDDSESDDDNDEPVVKSPKKKRKIIIPEDNSDDSSDEYKPDSTEDESDVSVSDAVSESEPPSESESDDESPKTNKYKNNGMAKGKGKAPAKKANNKDTSVHETAKVERVVDPQSWPHLKYDFLQPENIRDDQKRPPSHPDYDPKTLYVPIEFLDAQTPAMRQWWVLKSKHYDCLMLFKVWKFYEMYHMDAVIGAKELNLSYLKDAHAHVGFMEICFGQKYASLVEKGFKVARVEQTETPDMANARCAKMTKPKASKFDKVVRREVCQISTKGSRVFNFLDTVEASSSNSVYLLSIVEKKIPRENILAYGVCFIDTSIGEFYLGQFEDDQCNSKLLTLFAHFPPAHIIYERGNLSSNTLKLIDNFLPGIWKEALPKDTQFWSSAKVIQCLRENNYFKTEDSKFSWPNGLAPFLKKVEKGDEVIFVPKEDRELAVAALGGCVSTLKEYLLDQQLLSQRSFNSYIPPTSETEGTVAVLAHNMVLDAMTLNNLNVLGNEGSLIKMLDHCCTPFGKRLLREWICQPSCRKTVITERQKAVSDLLDVPNIIQEVRGKLSHLPDLDRLVSKIHAQGTAAKLNDHPDRRAIFCEKNRYTKRTINDFVAALNGFEEVLNIVETFSAFKNPLIKKCTSVAPAGKFPDLQEIINHFKSAFDQEEAKREGFITPQSGVDEEYDTVMTEFEEIKKESHDYLKKLEKHFGVPVKYVGTGYKRYQIEIPDKVAKKVEDDYELMGTRKDFKRYYTSESKKFLERQIEAEERNEEILKNMNRRIFSKFSDHYEKWSIATNYIAELDCLISLSMYAKTRETCIPEFHVDVKKKENFIEIKDGVHPCISSKDFTPNDTLIGGKAAPLMILTGPNMGGKSTLMRQVGLITIMAHIGCHVPAAECKLSFVDRVFTRLGASDDIVAGQSTFLVELTQTATILKYATKCSLVLLDELGRGTSTYDGTAIAASVVEALTKMNCRTLFSTHYHTLVEDYKANKNVALAHMACEVENEDEDEVSEENVKFLYKLTKGACPKSYGFNAARLAGMPPAITKRAQEIATKLEAEVNLRHAFTSLCRLDNDSVKSLIKKTRIILSSI